MPNNESPHRTSLVEGIKEFESDLGSVTKVNAETLPILNRLSIKRLLLAPGAIREPHWHANANELTYCVSGSMLVGILGNQTSFSTFTIGAGQMFFAPSGSLHHIENIGDKPAELIVAFGHELPEDFSFSGALGAMSDSVLGNTFDLPAEEFARIPRSTESAYIVGSDGGPTLPPSIEDSSALRFDVEGQTPAVELEYGSARLARTDSWPALDGMSMYSLRISTAGMREPHWHPETAEMGYVQQGRARMTVQDPDGSLDTYELGAGDVYFIPRAYPHQIEVLGDEEIHFLVYFDQATPGDVGYRASGSAFSREVVAATLDVAVEDLPQLPDTPSDPLIVARINPVDPD